MREWIGSQFNRIGLQDVHHQMYDLDPQWVPTSWEVSVTVENRTIRLESAHGPYGTVGTPADGMDLEPVWLGRGAESDFLGRDVKGKAAFVIAQPRPTARGHSGHVGAAKAVQRGAAAIIWVYISTGAFVDPADGSHLPYSVIHGRPPRRRAGRGNDRTGP